MKIKFYSGILLILFQLQSLSAQDNTIYKFNLNIPLADFPQNGTLPYNYPSMSQALNLSYGMYELGFWGIDELGDLLFATGDKQNTKIRKSANNLFKYALSLGFSKYGSELPIPLGVWGHEEFHRSAIGVKKISSKNGNWMFSRWDGTVYGISDLILDDLKYTDIDQLLNSYVAGVHYEILLNENISINDFYKKKSMTRSALLLYNAYYVFDYFRFSTSAASDSVKILAPPDESTNPVERDYTGSDLTAWVYDMFNPDLPFTSRDPFPGGEGVNRRIGFSDLSVEGRDFLIAQKKLSLLNFLNPAIFFIDRIKISENLDFNFFTRYAPVYFGNDIAVHVPVRYRNRGFVINAHRYSSKDETGFGAGLGIYSMKAFRNTSFDINCNFWNQPESFYSSKKISGGSMGIKTKYLISDNFSGILQLTGKTKGWELGNPYLGSNVSMLLGLSYDLTER